MLCAITDDGPIKHKQRRLTYWNFLFFLFHLFSLTTIRVKLKSGMSYTYAHLQHPRHLTSTAVTSTAIVSTRMFCFLRTRHVGKFASARSHWLVTGALQSLALRRRRVVPKLTNQTFQLCSGRSCVALELQNSTYLYSEIGFGSTKWRTFVVLSRGLLLCSESCLCCVGQETRCRLLST